MVEIIFDNRSRLIADVLSIDAWYAPRARGNYEVFADIQFKEARIGDDPDVPIRFKLSVTKALIRLHIPEDQSLSIRKQTIREFAPSPKITRRDSTHEKENMGASAAVRSNLSARNGADACLDAGLAAEAAQGRASQTDVKQEADRFIQVCSASEGGGRIAYDLEPAGADVLRGKPWSSKDALLEFLCRDSEALREKELKLVVTCKNEDLEITDLRAKQKEGQWLCWPFSDPRRAAAAQVIRERLIKGGLKFNDADNPYCEVRLADIIILQATP